MSVRQLLLIAVAIIGLSMVSSVAVIVGAKFRRGRADVRSRALLAPYRSSLLALASGEDETGQAKAELSEIPSHTWDRLRPSVIVLLTKVRGAAAEDLSDLLRSHGEVEKATKMLTSRSAVHRARAAYLFGLIRDPNTAPLVVPLLSDPNADVRFVATRSLGFIGVPSSASEILQAIGSSQGRIGVPAWIAAEALLSMGIEIAPALRAGLASNDVAVRNVCAVVAGVGTFSSAAPQLRILLNTERDDDVRVSVAVALGRLGGLLDAAVLASHTGISETAVLRRTCATALGEVGQPESLDVLSGLLGDGDRRLAYLAAESMVRIGIEGIAQLQEVASSPGRDATAARGALDVARLRGQLAGSAGES